jgi:aspartate kinase
MTRTRSLAVLKVGGSVLRDLAAFQVAATLVAEARRTTDRVLVVVSAIHGETDRLLDEARCLATQPDEEALDLLWSTGELRSVGLLTLALRATGMPAIGLTVSDTGLRVVRRRPDPIVELNPMALGAALERSGVVVVPGFLAMHGHRVVTLGRGGSDWTAVLLAVRLGARRCELIKDVDGYFTADPASEPDAARIERLAYADAIALAEAGCPLVQRQAIEAACDAGLELIVRGIAGRGTSVGPMASPGPLRGTDIVHRHQEEA